MSDQSERSFHPELLPRNGEITAWGLTLLIAFAIAYFYIAQGDVVMWMWIFAAFMLFSSLIISLGNWMDRRTIITLGVEGVTFENGLRAVSIAWNEVQKIAVSPERWGRAVHVIGNGSYFEFRTLGEMEFQGRVQARTGFVDGQKILDEMIRSAQLTQSTAEGPYNYYSRI